MQENKPLAVWYPSLRFGDCVANRITKLSRANQTRGNKMAKKTLKKAKKIEATKPLLVATQIR